MILDREFPSVEITEKAYGHPQTRTLDLFVRTLDVDDVPKLLDTTPSPANRQLWSEYKAERLDTLTTDGGADWFGKGIRTRSQIDDIIRKGWPEGVALVKNITAALVEVLPPPASIKRRTRWADEGDELDRDKLDRGEVDTMWRTSRRDSYRTAPQTVSIACSWGGHAGMSAEQLRWSAAAMLALSDVLEEAGYNTELFASYYISDTVCHVRVKRAGEGLAPDAVMAIVGHAGIFRCYGIGAMNGQRAHVGYGWGQIKDCAPGIELAASLGAIDPVEIILPHIFDKASAEKQARKVLAMMDEGQAVG